MSRRKEIDKKKAMIAELRKGGKPAPKKKAKAKKKKEIDADVNDDGVVDEKDLELVKKKIVKKKD